MKEEMTDEALYNFEGIHTCHDRCQNWICLLRRDRDRYKMALDKVARHGCCVMHNDSSCPGCTAKEALK